MDTRSEDVDAFVGFDWEDLRGFAPSPVPRERAGERARETGRNVNKYPTCKLETRNLNKIFSIATTLSPTLSRETGEGVNTKRSTSC
jgi:hypothetical protein